MPYTVYSAEDLEPLQARVRDEARRTIETLNTFGTDPLAVLHTLKFDARGYHPLQGHQLNLVEQLNQTFTVLASLAAAKRLLKCLPGSGGLCMHLATEEGRDIHSIRQGVVEAEVYASVNPRNNNKLKNELDSLAESQAIHRYVFFYSPSWDEGRKHKLERDGLEVEVWALGRSEIM